MHTMQELVTQEVINRMNGYSEERRKHKECIAYRNSHNQEITDMIEELTLIGGTE